MQYLTEIIYYTKEIRPIATSLAVFTALFSSYVIYTIPGTLKIRREVLDKLKEERLEDKIN